MMKLSERLLCQVPKVIQIGPLLLPADFPAPPGTTVIEDGLSEENSNLMQWLDTQPPRSVLFIAFGTIVQSAQEQIEEIAWGLEASEQAFLWAAGGSVNEQPKQVFKFLPPGQDISTDSCSLVVRLQICKTHTWFRV